MIKPQYLLEKLNASFWFIPILMLLFAIGLAIGLIYLDSYMHFSHGGALRYLLPASVDSAKSILTIIAGAMMGIAGMLNAAFNQIRQYGEGSPSVMIRLMDAMTTISTFSKNKNQKKLIIQHAKMIMKSAERTFSEKRDLEDIKERFNGLMNRG